MPTYRLPTFAASLPSGDYFDSDVRVDQRPGGRTRGEARRVRAYARPAVTVG